MTSLVDRCREVMGDLRIPDETTPIEKDECSFTFDTPFSSKGLFTNLKTFQSYCSDYVDLDHERTACPIYLWQKFSRVKKPEPKETPKDDKPVTKMAIGIEGGFKLDEDKYDTVREYKLFIYPQKEFIPFPSDDLPEKVALVADAVIKADSESRKEKVSAWVDDEVKDTKYADNLEQLPATHTLPVAGTGDFKCAKCDLTSNLWFNLSDGFVGCGRRNWDGSGGNNHAVEHYDETGAKFPLAVKLGTITPKGADVFSYAKDEGCMVRDPHLDKHLQHWGVNMAEMEKTEKTLAEMEIELNENFEFNKITEQGADLKPAVGPGFIGIKNLGNSCYMNSVMQSLMCLPEFRRRYFEQSESLFKAAPAAPSKDFDVQMAKLAKALLGSRYVNPERTLPSEVLKEEEEAKGEELRKRVEPPGDAIVVAPRMLKRIIGEGHPEFSTNRQQDALEYYQHLLGMIERTDFAQVKGKKLDEAVADPSQWFKFQMEARLQCDASKQVSYKNSLENVFSLPIPIDKATNLKEVEEFQKRKAAQEAAAAAAKEKKDNEVPTGDSKRFKPDSSLADAAGEGKEVYAKEQKEEEVVPIVPFEACLTNWAAPETVEDFNSPATGEKGTANRRVRFKTFPKYLCIHLRRYILSEQYVPIKLEARVQMPEVLDLEAYRGTGLQEGEKEMEGEVASGPQPDSSIVEAVMAMGFPENAAKRAALKTNNAGAEAAAAWVMEHMDDPDFDAPLEAAGGGAGGSGSFVPNPEGIPMLTSMGFTMDQAAKALKETDNNIERAADWLFSHADSLDTMDLSIQDTSSGKPVDDGPGKYELHAIVSHIGKNTGSGHYVCHIKKDGAWVIFNDLKVAYSQNPPVELGYMYFYRRV